MQILSNEQISMDCDPKLKPIATQSCTTGIECTTIINDNIGSSSHEETDRITNASVENENENVHENDGNDDDDDGQEETEVVEGEDEKQHENEHENDNSATDNDNENTNSEIDNVESSEDVNVDQFETSVEGIHENAEKNAGSNIENVSAEGNGEAESEELDESEVFYLRIFHPYCFFNAIAYSFMHVVFYFTSKITNVTNYSMVLCLGFCYSFFLFA